MATSRVATSHIASSRGASEPGAMAANELADFTNAELAEKGLDRARLPAHVAIIMDGNGRWARSRGLPRIEGHRRGVMTVRKIVEEARRIGLEQLTLYCFSSENWKRPPLEQQMLMRLLEQFLIEERTELVRQRLRFAVIGRKDGLGDRVLREIARTSELCADHTGMRLCLAVNYGSRAEIVDAARQLAADVQAGLLQPDQIDESHLAQRLDTAGMPDPDLVIRTAGEMRVSNFLLWQISYAELWVTQRYWPEFSAEDFAEALRDYANRDRRFGGLKA